MTMTQQTPLDHGLRFSARPEHIFPTLTAAQIERNAATKVHRSTRGDPRRRRRQRRAFLRGHERATAHRQGDGSEERSSSRKPGQFTGEVNMLSGCRALFRIALRKPAR
jgi:hypothetical protein